MHAIAINHSDFAPNSATWHIGLAGAVARAQSDADRSMLPQTVYRNADTCGWANVCFGSRCLMTAEHAVTVLPARFFY